MRWPFSGRSCGRMSGTVVHGEPEVLSDVSDNPHRRPRARGRRLTPRAWWDTRHAMASSQDVAAVRHFYDEVSRGNFWVGKEVFDPDIQWRWASPLSGITGDRTYRGLLEVEAATKDWLEPWESFRIELEDLIDGGADVVALTRHIGRPRGATAEVTALNAEVWTMRDGKAIAFCGYVDRAEARQAAGLQG